MGKDVLERIVVALNDEGIGEKIENYIDKIIELAMRAEEITCNIKNCTEDIIPYTAIMQVFISRLAEKKGTDFAIKVVNEFYTFLELMTTPLGTLAAQINEEFWREFKEEGKK